MSIDITDTNVYQALVSFAALAVPTGTPILRGQQNRIPMPNVPCVIITTLGTPNRIGTNNEGTEAIVVDGEITGFTASVTADFEYRAQADFYSPQAESWAMAAELLWRGSIGFAAMPEGMKPLYSEDRRQIPLIGGEEQYLQRWTMTFVLDYQPTWTQATEAATSLTIIPEPIEVFFPGWTADSGTPSDSGSNTADG
jgi:hypothetical protein